MRRLLLISMAAAASGLAYAACTMPSDADDQRPTGQPENAAESGILEITNRPSDLAIEGEGYFQVVDPKTDRFLFIRSGSFAVDANGLLVLASSDASRPVEPRLSLPSGAFENAALVVSGDGKVWMQPFGKTEFSQLGQLRLARFNQPRGLKQVGENLFQETPASGAATFGQPGARGFGWILQNRLERPNADYSSAHTNPTRKRGLQTRLPRLRFGLVCARFVKPRLGLMNNPG